MIKSFWGSVLVYLGQVYAYGYYGQFVETYSLASKAIVDLQTGRGWQSEKKHLDFCQN